MQINTQKFNLQLEFTKLLTYLTLYVSKGNSKDNIMSLKHTENIADQFRPTLIKQ